MLNRRDGLGAVAALGNDLDVILLLQQRQHALARDRLVVDDHGSNLVHATLSMGDPGAEDSEEGSGISASDTNGITIVTATPPPVGDFNSKR
jgi:hypothetical protein